jgi:predicted AlkP superfamily pyrophosphatase or phosphodiesterase
MLAPGIESRMLNSNIVQLSRRRFAATLAGSLGAARLSAIPPRPKLCVLLVAEQFRSDYLSRFAGLMGPGGFRRLMEEGAFLPDCRMACSSFSATGMATIATGAYAQAHGIVAESWYDSASRKVIRAGAELTQADTLADQVALGGGASRVFATAMNGSRAELLVRSAPFSRLKHTILPVDPSSDESGEPAWVETFRESHDPSQFKDAKWHAIQSDANAPPLRVLIDDPARPNEFRALYSASPFAQETQFDFLRTMLSEEKLGQGPTFDFVCVGLSAMALLGYEVGSGSPLMREMVLHLDRQIEATLETLKKVAGAGGFSLVFAAAHGAAELGGRAIDGVRVAQAINGALSAAFDTSSVKNRYVERYVYPFVYLNHVQLRRADIDPRKARRMAGEAALRVAPGVASYCTVDGDCSRSGEWLRRFQNSYHAVRCGDLMLSYEPNAVERFDAGRGISYGSLYNYDVQTPLMFYGPQFRAHTVENAVDAVDIAPTLARAMQVAMPSSSSGRVLAEVFAPDVKGTK